ncbi:hypothetical protein HDU98_006429 [Podochytrium sp. JEL0797]|nr:hypothetical protein HDU98_006429 [Podochytrium sp. JEL0797]
MSSNDTSSTIDVSFDNFQAALLANAILASAFLTAFAVLRGRFPLTYQPRACALPPTKRPTELGKSVLSILTILKANDKELLEKCGHDAFAAIFYTRTVALLFLAIAIPAALLILPLNATGGRGLIGLNLLTLGNIEDNNRLWAHFFFTVYVSAVTLYAIFRLISQSARLRQSFQTLPSKQQALAARTLMARDVPIEWRNEDALKCLFNQICADSVESVIMTATVPSALSAHINQEITARNNLEAAITKFLANIAQNHTSKPDSPPKQLQQLRPHFREYLIAGKVLDSIAFYSMEFRKTRQDILALREKLGMDTTATESHEITNPASTVFITFREPFQANLAARTTIHDAPAVMSECIPCVSNTDVVWETSNMNYFARQWRSLAAKAVMIWMAVCWAAIVTAVVAFTNLGNLARIFPFVHTFVVNYPGLAQTIGGILPPQIVAALIQMVPTIFRSLCEISGSPLKTATEQAVFSQYFLFQMCNVIFVNIVGSSLLASLSEIKDNPSSVFRILAVSIPQSSNFFVQYLLVTGMTQPSGDLLQVSNLFLNPIKAWIFGKTPRTLFEATQPPEWLYATHMGSHGITISIGLIFCVVAPLVSVFAAIYFWFYYAVYLYQFQYVYVVKNDTGGKYLFDAANHMFVGLFIMEFMVMVLFSSSFNFTLATLMLFIVAITIWSNSQARSFLSVIDTIPVKSMLDMEGTTIPTNPTTPYAIDETLNRKLNRALKKLQAISALNRNRDPLNPDATPSTEADAPLTTAAPEPTRREKFAKQASELVSFLIPGQDSSKYSKLISFFLPGLVVAMDAPVPNDQDPTLTASQLDTTPTTLFIHPKAGFQDLKIWIPEPTSRTITQSLTNFICQDGKVISRDRIVFCGSSMDEKGNVVLMEGMYDEMESLWREKIRL